MGEISVRWTGVQFARQQLNFGLQIISRIKSGDIDLPFDEYYEDVDNEQVSDEESSDDDEDCIYGGEDNSECHLDDDYIEKVQAMPQRSSFSYWDKDDVMS